MKATELEKLETYITSKLGKRVVQGFRLSGTEGIMAVIKEVLKERVEADRI